jgi:cell division protease FtsH
VAEVFQPLRLWPKRPAWTGSDDRVPSTLPPVTPPAPAPALNGQNGHHNGYANGSHAPGDHVPAGGAPLPPGQPVTPPQLPGGNDPGYGEPGSLPPRGPDFR